MFILQYIQYDLGCEIVHLHMHLGKPADCLLFSISSARCEILIYSTLFQMSILLPAPLDDRAVHLKQLEKHDLQL